MYFDRRKSHFERCYDSAILELVWQKGAGICCIGTAGEQDGHTHVDSADGQ